MNKVILPKNPETTYQSISGAAWMSGAGFYLNFKGDTKAYTASEYTAVTPGTKTLFIQTGSQTSERIPYGLTTDTTASEYSPVIMIDSKKHYIARTATTITETTSQREETYTRESEYVSYDAVGSHMTKTTTYSIIANHAASTTSSYYPKITEYSFAITSYRMGNIYNSNRKTLTLANTSFETNGSIIYFSTKQSVNAGTAVNGLVYLFLGSQTLSDNPLNSGRYEGYWENLPTNNTNYSYDGYRGARVIATSVSNVSWLEVRETERDRRDAYNFVVLESTAYPNITKEFSTNTKMAEVIKNTYFGGLMHPTSITSGTVSLLDNQYTRSLSNYSIGEVRSSSYGYNEYGATILRTYSFTAKITNNSTLDPQNVYQYSTFTQMTQRTSGSSTYRVFRGSIVHTTNTAPSAYYRVSGSFSKNSYIAGTTSYTHNRTYYGGMFANKNAANNARNHPIYSYRSTGALYTTIPKSAPYINYSGFSAVDIVDSISIKSVSRSSTVLYLLSHSAMVTTKSQNTTRSSTATNYYTDTVNTTVETNNVNA